ncbi:DeoR/GlpR family DNA-binding transcription regulator [Noviherbaspirillum saxi]|uniref:DeoR/GlpR transcriptional regulator n=1 Tax=Noviherbaspirillum saxi TaxID=2320863 RepID=A0A3A3FFF8_9BURK|nr:DeoR/GlpR family DNA-binding transcription regulator [Noviherbaspirillum saxi]RJF92071.1 DeoR/GlpR transcriptional regulator [Noviherbaspirillum saxi]
MLQEERLQRLRSILSSLRQIKTNRIATDLGVSRETVRRDVLELEALGELRRVHGGVIATGPEPEPPIDERLNVRLREKRRIAGVAAKLPSPGDTLFLDGGSTTVLALAEEIASLSGLTIITNSFDVALKLAAADGKGQPRHHVIMLGGQLGSGIAATYGESTVAEIYRHFTDWAFLSPVGIHPKYGATSYAHNEAAVARAMAQRAKRTVILADHSKIGQVSRIGFCLMEEIDTLIVDKKASTHPVFADLKAVSNNVLLA